MGGSRNYEKVATIESLNLNCKSLWTILKEVEGIIQRNQASVVAVSATKFVVFGGYLVAYLNHGYVFDIVSHKLGMILGGEKDLEFVSKSQTCWVGQQRFLTLGLDDLYSLHLVQMQYEHVRYAELRSV